MTKKQSNKTSDATETKVAKTKTPKAKTTAPKAGTKTPKVKTTAATETKANKSKTRAKAKTDSAPSVETKKPEQATTPDNIENTPATPKTAESAPIQDPVYEMDEGFDPPATAMTKDEQDFQDFVYPTDDKTFGDLKTSDPITVAAQDVVSDDEKQDADEMPQFMKDKIKRGEQIEPEDFFAPNEPKTAGEPEFQEKDGKAVALEPTENTPVHSFVDAFDDEDFDAENSAQRAATALCESPKLLEAVIKTANNEIEFRQLTEREKEKLAYYEKKIEDGLKSYVSIGKYFFVVWSENLFVEYGSWTKYVRDKWKMKNVTGSYDLMNAFKTWRLASSAEGMTIAEAVSPERWLVGETVSDASDIIHDGEIVDSPTDVCNCGDIFAEHVEDKKGRLSCSKCACAEYTRDDEATAARIAESANRDDDKSKSEPKKAESKTQSEPKSDADAPSQRAIEEMAKMSSFLERNGLTDDDFANFEKDAVRWLYQGLLDATGETQPTQKQVSDAMEAFIEFAKLKAVEIDGTHYSAETVNASDFRITRGLYEGLMQERQSIREILDDRRKRMSESQERATNEFSFVPDADAGAKGNFGAMPPENAAELETPHIYFYCSKDGWQKAHTFMYGAVQLVCSHVFGKPKGGDEVLFNPKLTKDNPIQPVDSAG